MTNDGALHMVGRVSIKAEMKVNRLSKRKVIFSIPPLFAAAVISLGLWTGSVLNAMSLCQTCHNVIFPINEEQLGG